MARAIWSGAISFGLVNIPVKLFTAVRDRDIHFHLLSKDGQCRLRRRLVCPDTGEEYDFADASKGYEIAPDQYVLVSENDIDRLRPEVGRTIGISDFVELDEIDPMLFDRPYYIIPEEHGTRPYRLLFQALEQSRKVAIATFVMRSKEYLAVVRPLGGVLCLETMRFSDEVVPVDELSGLPKATAVSQRELAMADQLIESLTTKFQPERYRDEYREGLRELIERKAEGEQIVAQGTTVDTNASGKVIDLMEALRKSLEQADGDEAPAATASKKKSAKKTRGSGSAKSTRATSKKKSAAQPRSGRRAA